jgi:hypothetical protein
MLTESHAALRTGISNTTLLINGHRMSVFQGRAEAQQSLAGDRQ